MADDPIVRLEPFVGAWEVTMSGAPWIKEPVTGSATFEWILGGQFMLYQASADVPEAPDVYAVIGNDPSVPGQYLQHYFDSRDVTRIYAMTFEDRRWTLVRDVDDFSEFSFSQRWRAEFSEDGDTIEGTWEMAEDHENYAKDFDLRYTRVSG